MTTLDKALSTTATRRIADLPGPPGWPLIGNLLQVDRERLHLQAEQWAGSTARLSGCASHRASSS